MIYICITRHAYIYIYIYIYPNRFCVLSCITVYSDSPLFWNRSASSSLVLLRIYCVISCITAYLVSHIFADFGARAPENEDPVGGAVDSGGIDGAAAVQGGGTYIYVHVHVYVYVHVHVHLHIHVHIHVHVCVYVYVARSGVGATSQLL